MSLPNLPFDVERYISSGDPLVLGEAFKIPRYGSITIEEYFLIDNLRAEIEVEAISNLAVSMALTTILLQCRFDRDWTATQTSKLPLHWIEQAADFLLSEQNRWQKPQPIEEGADEPGKKPDWVKAFWKLKAAFPHEVAFSRGNFAKCPLWLIEQALEQANCQELERAQIVSAATARLGVMVAQHYGSKHAETRHFNEAEAILFHQKAIAEIKPEHAAAFMALHKAGRVPEWVVDNVDVDLIRSSAMAAKKDG